MPRRPEQFEEIREKSREKILSAALELFARKGYGSTSIDSIAKKAGVSKGLIYNYYETKTSILRAIYEDAMSHAEDLVQNQKEQNKLPSARLRGMIEDVFQMMTDNTEYLKLLMVLSLQPEAMDDKEGFAKEMFKRNETMLESISGETKKKDPFRGLLFDAMLDGIMLNHIRFGNQYPLAAMKKMLIKEYCGPEENKKKSTTSKTKK